MTKREQACYVEERDRGVPATVAGEFLCSNVTDNTVTRICEVAGCTMRGTVDVLSVDLGQLQPEIPEAAFCVWASVNQLLDNK